MIGKLLTEHHLEFLSLTGGCRGSSKYTLVKMSNCWKSHAAAPLICGVLFLQMHTGSEGKATGVEKNSVRSGEESIAGGELTDIDKDRFERMSQDEKKQYLEKLRADPEIGKVIDFIGDKNAKILGQVKDAMSCFKTERFSNFSADQLLPFLSTSPTARKYMKACKHYLEGRTTLDLYGKQIIESEKDCDILQKSFRNYSIGLMTENALIREFVPPDHIFSLLDEYLIRRPSDVFAQHFKVCMMFRKVDERVSKYDSYKEKIIAEERLAKKFGHIQTW